MDRMLQYKSKNLDLVSVSKYVSINLERFELLAQFN